MTNAAAMSDLQLEIIVQNLPNTSVLWTRFEHQARDEYDRRVLALQDGKATAA
jgi:hypothetical protein